MGKLQLPAKLEVLWKPSRYKVAYSGRGAGKSWGFARALLQQGMQKPLRILCARETQRSIRDSVHRLLADQIIELGLTYFYEIQQAEIKGRNGTLFLFAGLGSLTVDSIKSFEGADRCWVEEGQTVTRRSWNILIPTIRRTGSEIWVSFNPDLDTDDTYTRFIEQTPPDTILIPLSWRDNPWFSAEMRAEMDHLKATQLEEWENVWEGKCRAAAQGAIYTKEMQDLATSDRVCALPADPTLKTYSVWDIGFNDATSIIICQVLYGQIRIIDHIEDTHRNLIDYANELKLKAYNWGCDWLPFDGAADRYKLTDPKMSPEGLLRGTGRAVRIVPKMDVETGIQKVRTVFSRVYFDKAKTVRLRECLKRYRRIIPATTDEPHIPRHDEFSHAADAFRYMCVVADQMSNESTRKPIQYPTVRHYA